MKQVIVIGSGFSGLSAACFLAAAGKKVTVLERHPIPGGRARQYEAKGFTFDMGPSWYWMPDVFERFFGLFGKKVSDYYELERLDPSYRIYWPDDLTDIPADYNALRQLFESMEPGSAAKLDAFMAEAEYKYEVGINKLVHKPGRSVAEFADWDLVKGVFRLDVFTSMRKHVARHFKHPKLQQLMEFPVLFLGALPQDTPALYSLMNYADIKLGTWFPKGGMYKIVEGMVKLAQELGVTFQFNQEVVGMEFAGRDIRSVQAVDPRDPNKQVTSYETVAVVGSADYHHIEQHILPQEFRMYTEDYWQKRVMAPSCLLYYVGINTKLPEVLHHSLFFDVDFEQHGQEIYSKPAWPKEPLFYVSMTSATDDTAAPEGCENLFFLIPVATGLTGDTEEVRDQYFEQILTRFEKRAGKSIREHIVYKRSYAIQDFINDYHSFRGNAYGLANTLMQTAILKPSMRSKKLNNLYFTGQLTVPGPGVPPSLISGEVVARELLKSIREKSPAV